MPWSPDSALLTLAGAAALALAAGFWFSRLPAPRLPAWLRFSVSLWIMSWIVLGAGVWVDLASPGRAGLSPLWLVLLLPTGTGFLHLLLAALLRPRR
jgi:hypothetical protein